MTRHFGASPTKEDLEKYARSVNWDGTKFVNLETTSVDIGFQNLPRLLYNQFFTTQGRVPKSKIPILPFNKDTFLSPSERTKFIWYGHSVVLLRMNNKTILIDPMMNTTAAPIAPLLPPRFSENTMALIDDFPEIDLLLITHDHYDHLDLNSIERLKPKVKKYFVALGVERHLVKWGVDKNLIAEFDWWDHQNFEDINITFTPSRHFSGRGMSDRAMSLWGGWTFRTATENIWFSGDGGYGKHFSEIGEREGPFDFGFMECGQYNRHWHQIHMYPEESVLAAKDARARIIMPVHWAGFTLAHHHWKEPADRFVTECRKVNMDYTIPALGAEVKLGETLDKIAWWTDIQ